MFGCLQGRLGQQKGKTQDRRSFAIALLHLLVGQLSTGSGCMILMGTCIRRGRGITVAFRLSFSRCSESSQYLYCPVCALIDLLDYGDCYAATEQSNSNYCNSQVTHSFAVRWS